MGLFYSRLYHIYEIELSLPFASKVKKCFSLYFSGFSNVRIQQNVSMSVVMDLVYESDIE